MHRGTSVGRWAGPAPAGIGITKIVIARRQAAFGGASFGSAGPYEFLTGTAYGELDPKAAMNAGIVNLQYAPVNARGHVEYTVDITILKPVDIKAPFTKSSATPFSNGPGTNSMFRGHTVTEGTVGSVRSAGS